MTYLQRFPRLVAFLVSLVAPVSLYMGGVFLLGPEVSRLALVVLVLILGFVLGFALFTQDEAATATGITLSALGGIFLSWVPVVVLTIGFALIAAPLLLAYAGTVYLGLRTAKKKWSASH
jgi:hypothetical protein